MEQDKVDDYISIFSLFFLIIFVSLIIFFTFLAKKKNNFRYAFLLLNLIISNLLLCFSHRLSIMYRTKYYINNSLCTTQAIMIGIFGNSYDLILFMIIFICYKIIFKNFSLESYKKSTFILLLISPYLIFFVLYFSIYIFIYWFDDEDVEYSFNEIFCFGLENIPKEEYLNIDRFFYFGIKIILIICDFIFISKIYDYVHKSNKEIQNLRNFTFKMILYVLISIFASLFAFLLRLYLIINRENDDDHEDVNWPYRATVYSYTIAGYLLSGMYIWNSGLYYYFTKKQEILFRDSINELSVL